MHYQHDTKSTQILKALILYFDVEQMMQHIIMHYRINVAIHESNQKSNPHRDSVNNNLGSQLQNKIRKTGFQIFKNVENRLKGTQPDTDSEVEPLEESPVMSPVSSSTKSRYIKFS